MLSFPCKRWAAKHPKNGENADTAAVTSSLTNIDQIIAIEKQMNASVQHLIVLLHLVTKCSHM